MRAILLPILAASAGFALSTPAQSNTPPAESGPARAERLLAAMGGRAAWAKVRWVQVQATHDDVGIARPFQNCIWNDFGVPRMRFEAHNADLDRRRVVLAAEGWRWVEGRPVPLAPEQIADEQNWWEANIYRTLHRLARRDPGLEARAVGAHRLEIFRADGKRLCWFHLHPSGAPMLFATWDSEAATVFGPLAAAGELRYPKWGGRPDGSWRYEVTRFAGEESEPRKEIFEQTERLAPP